MIVSKRSPCPSSGLTARSVSPPPIFLCLALHSRCGWVLHLDPVARSARGVARAEPLRDDAFEAGLAGMAKRHVARFHDVIVILQPYPRPWRAIASATSCGVEWFVPQTRWILLAHNHSPRAGRNATCTAGIAVVPLGTSTVTTIFLTLSAPRLPIRRA